MIRIGKIVATHGLQGDLIMTHITGRPDWLKAGDVLFVSLRKDSFIPFFVSGIKSAKADEFVLHLEETESVEAAKKLIAKEVFVAEEVLAKAGPDSPLLWIGFELVDKEKGPVGKIEDVFQTASQWLAQITWQGKEALVPLIEQTIVRVDIKGKKVHVSMPEGLLEIYL